MRTVMLAVALTVLASAARAGDPIAGFEDTAVVTGLYGPTALAPLPDGTLLVTERAGALVHVAGGVATTLGTIPNCHAHGEQGLLGIAIDPAFATNGYVYLYRTGPAPSCSSPIDRFNGVVRGTVSGGTVHSLTAPLVDGIRTDGGFHNGGGLRIGPDGKLYVSTGDSGVGDNVGCPGNSTNPYAQDLNALEGKVLRLELDGSIPLDNPYVGQAGTRPEIFASGFRNPFRFAFDPVSGGLWLGDVGEFAVEEIDLVTSGGNYAWPRCEGTFPVGCQQPGDIDPIYQYAHGNCPEAEGLPALGASVIGGVFSPPGFGAYGGRYFFADFVVRSIYAGVVNPTRDGIVGEPTQFVVDANGPVDMAFGPDGALYYLAFDIGHVRRVTPVGDQLIDGRKLSLKGRTGYLTQQRFALQSKDLDISLGGGPGTADDPTLSGATVRVVSATFDDTYPLPAGHWYATKSGYQYRDKYALDGPVTSGGIRAGRSLKLSAKGTLLGHTLVSNPNPVDVVITMGGTRFCMRFGGFTKYSPDRHYAASTAPAPASCPP